MTTFLPRLVRRPLLPLTATLLALAGATAGAPAALAHPEDEAPANAAPAAPTGGPSSAGPSSAPNGSALDTPAGSVGDVAAWGQGDQQGYHLYFARGEEHWGWRALATIQPPSSATDTWIGYQCLTGDGKHIVAVVAPRQAVNVPAARDRGALAYVVSIPSGRVRPLAQRVALKYHSPGCGTGDRVVLSRSLGQDQATTELISADAGSAKLVAQSRVAEQVTSAVPVGKQIWASSAKGVVDVTTGKPRLLHRTKGRAYALRPSGKGVDLLVEQGRQSELTRVTGRHRSQVLGEGATAKIALYGGRSGRNVAVGVTRWRAAARSTFRTLDAPRGGRSEAASLDGSMALSFPIRRDVASKASVTGAPSTATAGAPDLAPVLTGANGKTLGRPDLGDPSGNVYSAVPSAVLPGGPVASKSDAVTPKCAVPRNDLRRQVPQPNAPRVNWAIQQATRNLLQGSVLTRPANYANMGLAAFQPSSDFPRRPLTGYPSAPVPPQLIAAIYAQESAWHQASFRALPGVSGNPLVGDYYGAGGTLDRIEYNDADCGYGISQVTDAMTTASPLYSANGKAKVAVDYTENIAAGVQVMVDKWNQLAAAGVKMNNGDPTYLENWYFAAWAYNSGFYDNTGSGPWGLGWTNNPRNADYPPARTPFLRATYADAAHPGDWPYQERIMGWMESPMQDYKGAKAYKTGGILNPPPLNTFCNATNECDPAYVNGSLSYCKRADRKCWWHTSVTAATCPNNCHVGSFDVDAAATEPAGDDNYPPNCPTVAQPTGTVVVDEQPTGNLNVEGCAAGPWTNGGSFSVQYGANSSGAQVGQIDWHQLGTGFGGHTWFTKNRAAGDTAHIDTGTWTPSAVNGIYTVKAHVPASGASTSYAKYTIYRGDGTSSTRTINQHIHENRWVSLGTYTLQAGARVVLDNTTPEPPGTANVAYDALSFYKVAGTPVSATFDATTTFDDNTQLDTDDTGALYQTKPLDTHKNAYDWANGLTAPIASLSACVGTTRNTSCVGSATRTAVSNWRARVLAAGDHWVPNATETEPKWMDYSSPDPPSPITQAFLADRTNYKVRGRLAVDFRQSGGQIDPNSVTVQTETQTGDTHLPAWVGTVMRGVRDDYGVTLPDLSFVATDLNEWTHSSKRVDPLTTGVAPGRAYRPKTSVPEITDGGTCVRVKQITGGAIGLKPMVKSDSVRGAVSAWQARVAAMVAAGKAPDSVKKLADQIYDVIFSSPNILTFDLTSPFHFAPPIWVEQDARFCSDGSVKPGKVDTAYQAQIADSGYMPDLYLYVNSQPVNLRGQVSAPGPAQPGNFKAFAHAPTYLSPFYQTSPWHECNTIPGNPTFYNRRDGTPWNLEFDTSKDELADQVRFCDDIDAGGSPIHDLP